MLWLSLVLISAGHSSWADGFYPGYTRVKSSMAFVLMGWIGGVSPFQGLETWGDLLPQGDASLCPGLMKFAPLGLRNEWTSEFSFEG